jgi:uncharacterized protein YciI
MGQVALQMTDKDLGAVSQSLRDDHAHFLKDRKSILVTFGPIHHSNGAPAGYAYQTNFPGTDPESMREFLSADPFSTAGLYRSTIISGWRVALPHRQPTMPARPQLRGFFFHGIGKPNITARRNTLSEAHRAHLGPKDNTNCLSRGGLTDRDGQVWLGSAMVYEFPDRGVLDEFFKDEPFHTNGLYERIDIYNWQRGAMAV